MLVKCSIISSFFILFLNFAGFVSVDRVRNEDVSVYDEILSFYGGMGSFNDLVIDAGSGHDVLEHEVYSADMQLDVFRVQIATDARALKSGVF